MSDKNFVGSFWTRRNLIAFGLWCALLLGIVAGVTLNASLYNGEIISEEEVYRRLRFALLCFALLSALLPAESLFRRRLPLPTELSLLAFLFLAIAGSFVFGLSALPGWKTAIHAFGGALFALVALTLPSVALKDLPCYKRLLPTLLFAFLFAFSADTVWELICYFTTELSLGQFVFQLIFSAAGALLFLLPAGLFMRKNPERLRSFDLELIPKRK